jgi:hypothetical protein
MNEIDLLQGFRDDMPEPTTDAWLRARAAIAAASKECGTKRTRATIKAQWIRRPLYVATLAAVAVISAVAGAFLTRAPTATNPAALPPAATPAPAPSPSPRLLARVTAAFHTFAGYIVYTQSTTALPSGQVLNSDWWDFPWTAPPGNLVRQAGTQYVGNSSVAWSLSFVVPQTDLLSVGSNSDCKLNPRGFTIEYATHTWQSAAPPCVTLPPGLDMLVPRLQVIGHPLLDGQKTTELRDVTKNETFTLWISDYNYLPLQSQTKKKSEVEQETYSFDPPTVVNQARANLIEQPPAGFNQTLRHAASLAPGWRTAGRVRQRGRRSARCAPVPAARSWSAAR